MKKFTIFLLLLSSFFTVSSQTTLATWTCESLAVNTSSGSSNVAITAGGTAESGVLTTGSSITGYHASTSVGYSTPAGNGSIKALSSNFWAVGDYYQFKGSTTGYNGIKVTWDQTGSNTGPAPFKVQYSTTAGGTSGYTDFMNYTIPNNPAGSPVGSTFSWSNTTAITNSSFTADMSSLSALNNKSEVYFRLVCTATTPIGATSTFGTGGTNRVDNFLISGATVIPVELVDFKAQKSNTAAKLIWSTATELNNSHYNIERSSNGKTFDKIGEVSGYGNSNQARTYTFMDEKPNVAVNYYRLRQVDFDGKETISKAVSVNFDKNASIKVYPNVAKDKINIDITGDGGAADLSITNLLGQVVLTQKLQNTEGSLSVNVNELASGSYIVRVVSKGIELTQRFEKQ